MSTANPVELGEDASSVLLHGAHWASVMQERQEQGRPGGWGCLGASTPSPALPIKCSARPPLTASSPSGTEVLTAQQG